MAPQTNANPDSMRNAVRWGLLLAAIGTVGFRLPGLLTTFQRWRGALQLGDASAAESWRTQLMVGSIASAVVLAIGIAVFYAIRPRTKSAK